ncbi:malonyl CoA-acyl carrier protein transacylase, partial [Paenibacillus larvae]
ISDSSKRNHNIFHARKKLLHKMLVKAMIAKNYNEDSLSYAALVIPLFAQLQLAQERTEKMGDKLTEEELNHSIHLCKTIFAAKQIPVQEQLQILK